MLLLIACGTDNDTEEAESASEAEGTEASEPEADETASDDVESSGWPDTLRLGVIASDGADVAQENWEHLVEALEDDIGIDIELFTATDIAGIVEASVAGSIDVMSIGPFGAAIARNLGADFTPVAAHANDDQGPNNASVGWALAETGIESLEDLEGRSVCFGDPGSTTGYLYPAADFLELGIDPEIDLDAIFTGGHNTTAEGILAGDCDAGFTWRGLVEDILPAEGTIEPDDVNIFFSQPVQEGGVMVSESLPDDLFEAVTNAFLAANGPALYEAGYCPDRLVEDIEDSPTGEPWCTVNGFQWGYFPVDEDYFDSVWEVCEQTQAPACDG